MPIWQVAWFEYSRSVFKRSFFFVLMGLPALIALSIAFGLLMESLRTNPLPVGVVDRAGVITAANLPAELAAAWTASHEDALEIRTYPGEDQARLDLENGEIQAYYLLPPTYAISRQIEEVSIKQPGENARQQFFDYLQLYLLASQPVQVAYRLAAGAQVTVRSLDGGRETSLSGPTFGLLMPLFISMAFLFMLLVSSGYMTGAYSDENENRTLEVLLTSLLSRQLITGKVFGVVAISLTLLLAWAAVSALGISIAHMAGIAWFQDLRLDWRPVLAALAIALPAYVLVAALGTSIGALAGSTQEGQSISVILFILHMLPIYLSMAYIQTPHSPLAVILSLLPFSALITIGMRNLFTIVPGWQVAASLAVQVACACGALWLAGRLLRSGMLNDRRRLNWRILRTPRPG
jgi:ABC-2 type transport system permease protein